MNVPPVIRLGAPEILADLAAGGFDAEWDVFRASDVGAPHRRARWFCLAARGDRARGILGSLDDALRGRHGHAEREVRAGQDTAVDAGGLVADAGQGGRGARLGLGREARGQSDAGRSGEALADADGRRREGERLAEHAELGSARGREPLRRGDDGQLAWPPGPSDAEGWREWIAAGGPEPVLRGGAAGLPGRLDRLRCLGNAVVPAQAATAFGVLADRLRL